MGGTTSTLVVGGRIMNELNFSVDGMATYRLFSTASANQGPRSRILLADAWNCMPLTFNGEELLTRLASPGMPGAEFLRQMCLPWFERGQRRWNTYGFVAWDVLAAMALAEPELVDLVPYDIALNERLLNICYLEKAAPGVPAAHVNLVAPKDPAQAMEHIYQAWERALAQLA